MKTLSILLGLSLCLCGLCAAQELSGALSGSLGPGTYYIVGEISVQNGASLTIQPGTTLLANGDYAFAIYGHLHAAGTEADSIKFKCNTGVSYWNALHFINPSSSSSILEYCYVTDSNGRGISLVASSPTFSHCTIHDNLATYG